MLGVTTFVVQFWKTAMETFGEKKAKECEKKREKGKLCRKKEDKGAMKLDFSHY